MLTESQYILWEMKWRKFLNGLHETYARGPHAALTLADLAGDPPHDRAEDQATDLPRLVPSDIKNTACKALLLTQPAGTPEGTHTEINSDSYSYCFASQYSRTTYEMPTNTI